MPSFKDLYPEYSTPQDNLLGADAYFDQPVDMLASPLDYVEPETPLWYRGLRAVGGVLEPFMFFGDLTRAAVYDLVVKDRDRSEFLTVLSNAAKYAPLGESPEQVARGDVLAKELFGAEGKTANAIGFFLEVALDPLVFLDLAGTAVARSASRGAAQIVGRKVGSANEIANAAAELATKRGLRDIPVENYKEAAAMFERVGDQELAQLFRYASRREFGDKLRSPVEWIPEPVRKAIAKTTFDILDSIAPLKKQYAIGGGTRSVDVSLAEAFMTPDVYYATKTAGTPHEQAVKNLLGSADPTKLAQERETEFIGSLLDEARGRAAGLQMATAAASKEIVNIFSEATGKTIDEAPELYTAWSKITGEWLDKIYGDRPLTTAKILRERELPDAAEMLQSGLGRKNTYTRIATIAKIHNADPVKLFNAAEKAAVMTLKLAWEYGWKLSGMDDFYKTIDTFAERAGRDASEISYVVWKKANDMQLDEDEMKLLSKFNDFWKKQEGAFTSIEPVTFIRNVADGYFRRVMGINVLDDKGMKRIAEALQKGKAAGTKWLPASDLNSDDFIAALEEVAGTEAANRMAEFLFAYGDGAFTPEQLARMSGVPMDDIMGALARIDARDIAPDILEKIQSALMQRESGVSPLAPLTGKKAFSTRKVPEEEIGRYLPLTGVAERLSELGRVGSRALTNQEIQTTIWRELSRIGAIYDKPYDALKMVDEYGVKLFKVPENPDLYGNLAGKYIPRYAADQILTAVQTGDAPTLQRALGMLRVGWLANPATIARNVTGGLNMMRDAGMTPQEITTNINRARKLISEVMEHGDTSILGPGVDGLKLFSEGSLSMDALENTRRGVERVFDEALAVFAGKKDMTSLERLAEFGEKVIRGGKLFDWFQASEDIMRTATFLATRDRLVARGIPADIAGRQAAAVANRILFDYANQPLMVRILKRYGLMLFPSFAWFNLGRTATLAARRPSAIAGPLRFTQASQMWLPEEERRNGTLAVYNSWLADENPILIPHTSKPGAFFAVPVRNILPALGGFNVSETMIEPMSGGALRGIIDVTTAFIDGMGKGAFSSRYGRTVFEPYATPLEQKAQAALFLGTQYAPGYIRTAADFGYGLYKYYIDAQHPEVLYNALNQKYGKNMAEVVTRMSGIGAYPFNEATRIKQIARVRSDFERRVTVLRREMREAAAAGDERRFRKLIARYEQLTSRYMDDIGKVIGTKLNVRSP